MRNKHNHLAKISHTTSYQYVLITIFTQVSIFPLEYALCILCQVSSLCLCFTLTAPRYIN